VIAINRRFVGRICIVVAFAIACVLLMGQNSTPVQASQPTHAVAYDSQYAKMYNTTVACKPEAQFPIEGTRNGHVVVKTYAPADPALYQDGTPKYDEQGNIKGIGKVVSTITVWLRPGSYDAHNKQYDISPIGETGCQGISKTFTVYGHCGHWVKVTVSLPLLSGGYNGETYITQVGNSNSIVATQVYSLYMPPFQLATTNTTS